jgi:N-formylglutamate deformylase
MSAVEIHRGTSPVILGFPHTGTDVPGQLWDRLNENGRILADTDWHVHRLYDGLLPNATTVRATFHRYVIDANRDLSGASLYPGQNTTGLIPETDFDGKPIWREGSSPAANEYVDRLVGYDSYHASLVAEIARVKAIHGVVVLYDCHSIRAHIPFLFDGRLPDFNIGTNDGKSCGKAIESVAMEVARHASGFSSILNGRFKGGYTTRHYGNPATGVHAIQMELAQYTHLATESPPFAYDQAKADALRVHLRDILQRIDGIARREM